MLAKVPVPLMNAVLSLGAAFLLCFFLLHAVPGDPADRVEMPGVPPEQAERSRHALGLDLPLPAQLARTVASYARLDLGVSQTEVARRIGVNLWTLGHWENGQMVPKPRCIPAIGKFLGDLPAASLDTLPERLRSGRERFGGSLSKLASQLKLKKGTLVAWERGQAAPRGLLALWVDALLRRLERF